MSFAQDPLWRSELRACLQAESLELESQWRQVFYRVVIIVVIFKLHILIYLSLAIIKTHH